MALNKDNRYLQVKVNDKEYELVTQYSKLIGVSISWLLNFLIKKYLPKEVNTYLDKLEVKNEKTS